MKNQIPPHRILRVSIACVLAVAALASLPLHAATVTWDGSTDMTWTQPDSTSWTGDTYNSGDTAQFLGAGAGTVTIDAGGVTPAAVIVNSSADYTFTGGAIGNSSTTTLTKTNTGRLTLSNANTYTGLTTVSGGVLDVGVISGNAVSTNSGIFLTGTNSILQGSGTFTRVLVTGSTPGSGQIAGVSGGFAARGGQLTVRFNDNSSTEVTMGSSSGFGSGFAFGSTSADNKVVVENNINLNTPFNSQRTFIVTAGVGGAEATSAELSGVIRNTGGFEGGITKQGDGMLIISGTNNSYNRTTLVDNGILSIASIKNLGVNSSLGAPTTLATGRIFLGSTGVVGTLRYTGTGDTTDREIYLNGINSGGVLDQSGAGLLKFTSNIGRNNGDKTFTLQGSTAGTGEISGNIANPGTGAISVTKTGTGRWTLSGTNTYSGRTTVTQGVLDVGVVSAGGLSANSGLFLGATNGATTGILQGSGTFTRSLSGNTNPTSAQVAGRNAGFAARGGDLTVNLGGAAAQISLNTTGEAFGQNFVFGSSSADGKVILVNPINLNTSLNAQRTITVNAGIGGAAATSAELQGAISNGAIGANGIAKQGNGMLILSGNNTYSGTTTVNAGSLIVNGSVASVLNVQAGSVLGGSGNIAGATTISGSLRPGNSIGTLTVANDVTWNGGEAWVFELGGAGPSLAAPGASDFLSITGAGSDFLKGTGSSWTFDFAGSATTNGWYKLVEWGGNSTFDAINFTGINLGGGFTSQFSIQDNALYLNVVPEPSTYAMLALAAVGALAHRFSRRGHRGH